MVTAAKSRCYVVLEPSDKLREIYFSEENPFEDDKAVPTDVIKGVKKLIEDKLYPVAPGLLPILRSRSSNSITQGAAACVAGSGTGTDSGQQEYPRTEDGTEKGGRTMRSRAPIRQAGAR